VGKSRIQDSGFGKKKGRFRVSGAGSGFRIRDSGTTRAGFRYEVDGLNASLESGMRVFA
jgi:hypothetical protein